MMEVRVRQGKGKQVEARSRFHRIVCDQPFEEGGSDTGMTPPELMLASLGSCAMYYAAEFLRSRNLPSNAVELKVSAEKSEPPVRLAEIFIEVEAPGLAPRTRDGLLKAIQACLLGRTLANSAAIHVSISTAVAESPLSAKSNAPATR